MNQSYTTIQLRIAIRFSQAPRSPLGALLNRNPPIVPATRNAFQR